MRSYIVSFSLLSALLIGYTALVIYNRPPVDRVTSTSAAAEPRDPASLNLKNPSEIPPEAVPSSSVN